MGDAFLDIAITLSLALLALSFLFTTVRVILGPTLPDRIVALDMMIGVVIGFIAVIGIKTEYYLYVDIAIALGLVGFLATVAFARFVLARGREKTEENTEENIGSVNHEQDTGSKKQVARRTAKAVRGKKGSR